MALCVTVVAPSSTGVDRRCRLPQEAMTKGLTHVSVASFNRVRDANRATLSPMLRLRALCALYVFKFGVLTPQQPVRSASRRPTTSSVADCTSPAANLRLTEDRFIAATTAHTSRNISKASGRYSIVKQERTLSRGDGRGRRARVPSVPSVSARVRAGAISAMQVLRQHTARPRGLPQGLVGHQPRSQVRAV